jgi:hypothetical protein
LNHHNAIARQASLVCGNENASGKRANVGAGVLVDAVGWRVMPSIFSDGLGFEYFLIYLSEACIDFVFLQ